MTSSRRRITRRVLGLAATGLLACSAGAATLGATAAYAKPVKLSALTISVKTGNPTGTDDKRRDSVVELLVDTTKGGTRTLVFSPASVQPGPGGSADDVPPFKLDPGTFTTSMPINIDPGIISGFRLRWLQGHNGWLNGDEWDFGGISVSGHPTDNSPDIPLLDAMGLDHHFNKSQLLGLASFPNCWSGSFDGSIIVPPADPVHADVQCIEGQVTGDFTLAAPATLSACGQSFTLPPATEIELVGTRVDANNPAPGWMKYTLTKQFTVSGFTVTLELDITVSPSGSTARGTATLTGLPPGCGFTPVSVSLAAS